MSGFVPILRLLIDGFVDLCPYLLCAVALLLNAKAIASASKTAVLSYQLRRAAKIPAAALAAWRPAAVEAGPTAEADPILAELTAVARVAVARAQGSRPVLALLRDLYAAELLGPAHCAFALQHLCAQGDLLGAQGVLMLAVQAQTPVTNSMVLAVLSLLAANGGDAAALELYQTLLSPAKGGDYYLDAPVLEDLLRAAARVKDLALVERLFQHLHSVGSPSVQAYGLVIHALGDHGAVNDAVNLFEELLQRRAETGEDVSPAWNSLLAALARNLCLGRAEAVFNRGRSENLSCFPSVALALCEMAPDRFTAPELWIDGRPASQGPAKARYSTRPDRKPQQCPRQRKRLKEEPASRIAYA